MIYDTPAVDQRIDQGDIIDACPVVEVVTYRHDLPAARDFVFETHRVIVLTQTCDLEQRKTLLAVVAVVEDATDLVARGVLKESEVRGNLLKGRVWGMYLLPADPARGLPEMIADFRRLHTVRLDLLAGLCRAGQRRGRVRSLYREHLSKHFADGYCRIGLPQAIASE